MTPPAVLAQTERLRFLLDVAKLAADHLQATDGRLFAESFTVARAQTLGADQDLSERLDAFVARFSRLQDIAGDKLLPALLTRLGEPVGSVLDNLDRAARLGLLNEGSDAWLTARALRNRMVHEYFRKPDALAEAVCAAHAAVPMLTAFARACDAYARDRQLI